MMGEDAERAPGWRDEHVCPAGHPSRSDLFRIRSPRRPGLSALSQIVVPAALPASGRDGLRSTVSSGTRRARPRLRRRHRVTAAKRCAAVHRAGHNGRVSSYAYLRVGSLIVSHLRNGVSDELMTLFRDDMLDIRHARASEYYSADNGYEESSLDDDHEIDVVVYRAAASIIADRLDLMGVTSSAALAFLDEELNDGGDDVYLHDSDREVLAAALADNDRIISASMKSERWAQIQYVRELRKSLNSTRWLDLLAAAPEGCSHDPSPKPGSRLWLLEQLDYGDYWAERHVLRAVLMAFPDAEVTLDLTDLRLTDLNLSGGIEDGRLPWMASDSAATVRRGSAVNAPVVVLTEGRTDAEFLRAGLKILYPHLTDLIRFLDYDYKPEGSASALVRMVRAFAAAGIVNRVVAVFDNDTAAADGLKHLEIGKLPGHIQVICYPRIDLASSYPTLGPPTVDSPRSSISLADVNGSAGSIELYLGRDVLAREDGTLSPVKWKSYIPGMDRYQGEVIDKQLIHDAFRTKCAMALQNHAAVQGQDWEGLRLVIDAVRAAALASNPEPSDP